MGSVYGKIFLLLTIIFFIASCKELPMNAYDADQITSLKIELIDANSTKIKYRTMLETLYFCPGANVVEGDNEILVTFVRCPIKKSCHVTHKAVKEATGEDVIVVEHNKMPIFLVSDTEKIQIYPE